MVPVLLIAIGIAVLVLGKRLALLGAAVGALLGVALLRLSPGESGPLLTLGIPIGLAVLGFMGAGFAKGNLAEAGISAYILKDDQAGIRDLANVVVSVADGGICFSHQAHLALLSTNELPAAERLSGRQLEAISLCAAYPNHTTADIAQMMAVSNSTVRNLLSGAYVRLGVRTRGAAIEKARKMGLITPRPPTFTPSAAAH